MPTNSVGGGSVAAAESHAASLAETLNASASREAPAIELDATDATNEQLEDQRLFDLRQAAREADPDDEAAYEAAQREYADSYTDDVRSRSELEEQRSRRDRVEQARRELEAQHEARRPPAEQARLDAAVRELQEYKAMLERQAGGYQEPPPEIPPDRRGMFPPAFSDDPAENLNARLQGLEQLAQGYQQQLQAEQQAQAQRQIVDWVGSSEATFKRQAPDYDQAIAHLAERMKSETAAYLQQAGHVASPEMVNRLCKQAMERELIAIAQQGLDPAQVMYRNAKAAGYTGPKKPKPTDPMRDPDLDQPGSLRGMLAEMRRERWGAGS